MDPQNTSVAIVAVVTALTTLAATLTGLVAGLRNFRAINRAAQAGVDRGDDLCHRLDAIEEQGRESDVSQTALQTMTW